MKTGQMETRHDIPNYALPELEKTTFEKTQVPAVEARMRHAALTLLFKRNKITKEEEAELQALTEQGVHAETNGHSHDTELSRFIRTSKDDPVIDRDSQEVAA